MNGSSPPRGEHYPALTIHYVYDGSSPHPRGTRVKVVFSLPGEDDPIEMTAEYVETNWEGEQALSRLRFVNPKGNNYVRITSFIESHEKKEQD